MRAIGLMSGTSLDGIDAALVDIAVRGAGYAMSVVRFETFPFAPELRARLLEALPPNEPVLAQVTALDRELGAAFTCAALHVAAHDPVDFIASHGLTLFHRGEARETLQIGEPYGLRDALRACVLFDFRRADCAAGGNGAPLVPFVDALLFASSDDDVVALNIGGIANVTVLRRGEPPSDASAWDTGPGNMLLDAFVARRTGDAQHFDALGGLAARGHIDARALGELVAREAFYLLQPPPKSTGRERFGAQLLDAHRDLFGSLSLEDGCATLCAFTAATIADSLAAYGPAQARLIVSGGGAHNATLLRMLATRLPAYDLVRSDAVGIDPDAKEALAFAILAYEALRGRPANLPRATGAQRAAVLGAIAPYDLAALLAKIHAECAANVP